MNYFTTYNIILPLLKYKIEELCPTSDFKKIIELHLPIQYLLNKRCVYNVVLNWIEDV